MNQQHSLDQASTVASEEAMLSYEVAEYNEIWPYEIFPEKDKAKGSFLKLLGQPRHTNNRGYRAFIHN